MTKRRPRQQAPHRPGPDVHRSRMDRLHRRPQRRRISLITLTSVAHPAIGRCRTGLGAASIVAEPRGCLIPPPGRRLSRRGHLFGAEAGEVEQNGGEVVGGVGTAKPGGLGGHLRPQSSITEQPVEGSREVVRGWAVCE